MSDDPAEHPRSDDPAEHPRPEQPRSRQRGRRLRREQPRSQYHWGSGEPSLWQAIRHGTSAVLDDLRHVGTVNAGAAVAGGVLGLLVRTVPLAAPVLLVFVPVLAGLARMAGVEARGGGARLGHFRQGIRHRWRAVLGTSIVATAIAAVALVNLGVTGGMSSLVLIVALVLSVWVLALEYLVALCAVPLLGDPRRDDLRVRDVLRLAVVVITSRPLRVIGLAGVVLVGVGVAIQTWVGWFLLPALGLAVAAHVVLPVADTIAPVSNDRGHRTDTSDRDAGLDAGPGAPS